MRRFRRRTRLRHTTILISYGKILPLSEEEEFKRGRDAVRSEERRPTRAGADEMVVGDQGWPHNVLQKRGT